MSPKVSQSDPEDRMTAEDRAWFEDNLKLGKTSLWIPDHYDQAAGKDLAYRATTMMVIIQRALFENEFSIEPVVFETGRTSYLNWFNWTDYNNLLKFLHIELHPFDLDRLKKTITATAAQKPGKRNEGFDVQWHPFERPPWYLSIEFGMLKGLLNWLYCGEANGGKVLEAANKKGESNAFNPFMPKIGEHLNEYTPTRRSIQRYRSTFLCKKVKDEIRKTHDDLEWENGKSEITKIENGYTGLRIQVAEQHRATALLDNPKKMLSEKQVGLDDRLKLNRIGQVNWTGYEIAATLIAKGDWELDSTLEKYTNAPKAKLVGRFDPISEEESADESCSEGFEEAKEVPKEKAEAAEKKKNRKQDTKSKTGKSKKRKNVQSDDENNQKQDSAKKSKKNVEASRNEPKLNMQIKQHPIIEGGPVGAREKFAATATSKFFVNFTVDTIVNYHSQPEHQISDDLIQLDTLPRPPYQEPLNFDSRPRHKRKISVPWHGDNGLLVDLQPHQEINSARRAVEQSVATYRENAVHEARQNGFGICRPAKDHPVREKKYLHVGIPRCNYDGRFYYDNTNIKSQLADIRKAYQKKMEKSLFKRDRKAAKKAAEMRGNPQDEPDEFEEEDHAGPGSALTASKKHYTEDRRFCSNCGTFFIRSKFGDEAWYHFCACQARLRDSEKGLRPHDWLFISQLGPKTKAYVQKAARVFGPLAQLAMIVFNRSFHQAEREEIMNAIRRVHEDLRFLYTNVGNQRWFRFGAFTPEQFVTYQALHNDKLSQIYGPDHDQLIWLLSENRPTRLKDSSLNSAWAKQTRPGQEELYKATNALKVMKRNLPAEIQSTPVKRKRVEVATKSPIEISASPVMQKESVNAFEPDLREASAGLPGSAAAQQQTPPIDGLQEACHEALTNGGLVHALMPATVLHHLASTLECKEESVPESSRNGDQLQAIEGASTGPVGRSDQDVSASRDRVSAAIPVIVLSSDEEDDPEEPQEPEMSVIGGQNQSLFFEDEYRLMNEDGHDESSDEATSDEALDEELNGNLFFEEVYKRLSNAN